MWDNKVIVVLEDVIGRDEPVSSEDISSLLTYFAGSLLFENEERGSFTDPQ